VQYLFKNNKVQDQNIKQSMTWHETKLWT